MNRRIRWPRDWDGLVLTAGDEPPVTGLDLKRIWLAIPLGSDAICHAGRAGRRGMSSRRIDIAMKKLKRAGMARFGGRKRGWIATLPPKR